MKILLVAATTSEIEPLQTMIADYKNRGTSICPGVLVDVLITGVGMVATAYALGRHLALHQYNLAINAGIAGSFDFSINLGDVVLISEDIFSEQGAEDGESFLSLNELGFGDIKQFPLESSLQLAPDNFCNKMKPKLEKIKKVKAITVNKVHGHEFSILTTLSRFKAQVESMEGAAFFYACTQSQTPCLQIRSVSNYVEPRNKENWEIGLAVKNLNDYLIKFIQN